MVQSFWLPGHVTRSHADARPLIDDAFNRFSYSLHLYLF